MSTRNRDQQANRTSMAGRNTTAASKLQIAAVVLLVSVMGFSIGASAQQQDNFDLYAPDSFSIGQGDWYDWDGGVATGDSPIVRDILSYSPGNSLQVGDAGVEHDTAWVFSGATSGLWEFRAMTYVPASSTTNVSYIAFMNEWPGTVNYMSDAYLDMGASTVRDSIGPVTAPLIRNAWVEYRTVIDIDAQTIETFYNGAALNSGAWSGVQEVVAVDIYSPGAGGAVFYDDLQFAPVMTIDSTLTRDDVGTWGDGLWKDGGAGTAEIPTLGALGTSGDAAVVNSGALNVSADQSAYSLEVVGGSVTIDPGATLTIYDATTVALPGTLSVDGKLDTYSLTSDSTIDLGVDAVLHTDSGTLAAIDTVGDATFEGGADVTELNLAAGSTFTKAWGGILNVELAGTIPSDSIIRIEGGELRLQAFNPLNNADVVLSNGRLTTDQGDFMTGSDITVSGMSAINPTLFGISADYGNLTFADNSTLFIEGVVDTATFLSTTVSSGVSVELAVVGSATELGGVDLQEGASLLTSGGSAVTLGQVTLSGANASLGRSGAGELALNSYAGGAGKTLTIIGGGRTVLGLGATDAVGTKFVIADGSTLAGSGAAPLAGSTELEFAGGTLELTGTTSMTPVTMSVASSPQASILSTDADPSLALGGLSFVGDSSLATAGDVAEISFTSTSVDAGVTGVLIADNQTVDVGPISVSEGGVFVAETVGTGAVNYDSLTLANTSGGIGAAAGQEITVHDYSDGGAAKTLLISGAGTTRLDYGGSLQAGETTIKVTGGSLVVSGSDPLAGAKAIVLAGGSLDLPGVAGPVPGAVAYYSFDNVDGASVYNDGSGGDLYDATTFKDEDGVTAVTDMVTTGQGGMIGEALTLRFDEYDHLRLDASGGVPMDVPSWTIATWYYNLHSSDNWRVLAKGVGGDMVGFILSGRDWVWFAGGGYAFTNPPVNLTPGDGWHHLAFVGEGGSTQVYVDGVWAGQAAKQLGSEIFRIGNNERHAFAEKLDEFLIYHEALEPAEIQSLYNSGLNGMYPIDMTSIPIEVEADSAISVEDGVPAQFGDLTFTDSDATLTVEHESTFQSLTLGAGVTKITLNTGGNVSPGVIDGGATGGVEIVKDGDADLLLSGAGVNLDDATFTVLAGRLFNIKDPSPVGAATLHPAGGEIVLGSHSPGATVNYTNEFVSDGGRLTAGWSEAAGLTVNIPGGLTLDSGDLELRTDNGASFNITGELTGAGAIDVGPGAVVTPSGSAPYTFGGVILNGGEFTTDQALAVGKLELHSGTFNRTGSAGSGLQDLTIANSLKLDNMDLNMTGTSLDIMTATAKINNATLTVDAPVIAATMDLSEGGSLVIGGDTLTVSDSLVTGKGQFTMSGAGSPVLVSHGNINSTTDPTQLDLAGGKLLITGIGETYPNQLNYGFYDGATNAEIAAIDDGIANGLNGGLFALTPTEDSLLPTQVQGKAIWTGEIWQAGNISDTYSQMWSGTFNAPETGVYTFYVHGDDHEILWMDLNQNGEFDSLTERVTDNPVDPWDSPKTETVTLEAGESYDFALTHSEGGGGDWIYFEMQTPSMDARVRINPSDPEQFDWWSIGAISSADIIMPTTDLLVTEDSVIDARLNTELGVLKIDGENRTVVFDVGVARVLSFQSTEITGAANLTLDIDGSVLLTKTGGLDAGGASTINKIGSGEMILSNPITNLGAVPVLNVNEGALALTESGLLGGADLQIAGGGLKLASPAGQASYTHNTPFTIGGDASLIAGPVGGISQAGANVIYDADVNAGANTLTLGSVDGYSLDIGTAGTPRDVTAGQLEIHQGQVTISGQTTVAGAINVTGPSATFDGAASAAELNIDDGAAIFNGPATIAGAINIVGTGSMTTSAAGDTTESLAVVNTASINAVNPLTVTDRADIGADNGSTLEIVVSGTPQPGDSFTLSGANLVNFVNVPNTLNLQGGTTSITHAPAGNMIARYVRVTGDEINDANEADNVLQGNLGASQVIVEDFSDIRSTINMEGDVETFPNGDPWPNGVNDASLDDFAVEAVAEFFIPQGDWMIGWGSDDGGFIQMSDVSFVATYNEDATGRALTDNDGEVYFGGNRGYEWTSAEFTVPAGGVTTQLRALMYERSGGDSFELAIRSGHHGAGVNSTDWTLLSSGALGWTIPAAAETVVMPETTVVAPVDSTLELTVIEGDTVTLGGMEVHDNATLTIDAAATGITLDNLSFGAGSMVRSTRAASTSSVDVTVADKLTIEGDGVSYLGDTGDFGGDGDDELTNLTLGDGAVIDWILAGDGAVDNYLVVKGLTTQAGSLTVNILDGGGTAAGDNVTLLYSIGGVAPAGPPAVALGTLPVDWTAGVLEWVFAGDGPTQWELVLNNLTAVGTTEQDPGDTDGDRIVDADDLANFQLAFGLGGAELIAKGFSFDPDFDDDGDADLDDFVTLRQYFGTDFNPVPAPVAPTATPEPCSAVLMLLGLGAVVRRRGNRQGR